MEGVHILLLSLLVAPCICGGSRHECDSPQFLEVGKVGIIECTFQDDFYAISWYTAVGFSEQTDLIRLVDGETIGEGFSSGEFDIRDDGSLIINKVTLLHENNFTAVIFQSQGESTVTVEALVFVKRNVEAASPYRTNLWWILSVIAPLCLLVILCRLFVLKDLKTVFKRELKTKYKCQYDAVQPIPYIRDLLYCVDRVFVEGGFEKLMSRYRIEGLGKWEKLTSYHEVTDVSSSSTRTIIEGDPGYGKSTLTLQLAYDWCNCNAKSPLAAVDILILLRLRQLDGVCSLVRAIKQFILPRDSRLNETDIEAILRQSRSTVIILDGFDEYPEEQTGRLTDIYSIIRGEMFKESFVILTTRSFFLPNSYPPQSHRIRLTGFDSKARDTYIRKAVVGDNTRAAEKIKQSLQKNSLLQRLCQFPLFFVMFAHMTHESEKFIKFKSVTRFFKYMIACFHSHMKNKMDLNVKKLDLRENDHDSLDEVAFQGLSGKTQKIVWRKDDLVKRLGKEYYDQYIRIGILVEVLDETDIPGDIRYDTEVRFYHKLFCEWYAAHCLCRKVVEPGANLPKILENMNPFDLQYTYRFVCGLSSEAGNKIIEYLRGMKDGDKFAVLCLLEQSGQFDQIRETVHELCSNYITIENNDSLLLQGSIIQLLEIGSNNQIPISFVWLKDCFNSIDLSSRSILLKSGLSISSLPTLKELVITERGRILKKEEFSDILDYSARCPGLKSLRFYYLSMPKSVSKNHCSFLQQRKLQVLWCTDEGDYLLSHRSGEWEPYDPRSSQNVFQGDIPAKKNFLISLMKKKYHEITAAVPIVPTHPDRLYNVNEIFVDSGLQYMVAEDKDESNREWEPLNSYRNIFTGSHAKFKRHVLQGKPGFGKSMMALKMAYDWCMDIPESPLTKVDLFFFVQLTLDNTSKSIYTHLKRCVLPKDSPLTEIDIEGVLRECSSAVMVLDDFNLYANEQTDEKNDVIQIIRGKMLKDINVITTSTFVPQECMPGTNKVRLTGFDDKARDVYINKVVVGDSAVASDSIMQKLRVNYIFKDFFNVPLFFSMFVQMSREENDLRTLNTFSTFTSLMKCLQSHTENQGNSHNEDEHFDIEKDHLDKVAFDYLCGSDGCYMLDKENICKAVGKECYNEYLRLGILVEEKDEDVNSASNSYRREAQFYHELFCKWFAAHYIAKHATGQESEKISNILTKLVKPDLQILCYVVGKLNGEALEKILYLVRNRFNLARLSTVLFEPNSEAYRLSNDVVKLENGKEESIQKARIRLLKVASKAKISISEVFLDKCYSTVNLSGGNHLQLKSKLSIPVLTTLKKLKISTEYGREKTAEEIADILQYSSKCLALEELWFLHCLLPQSFQAESVSVLRSTNVKVYWDPRVTYGPKYQLNLNSGLWQNKYERVMTNENYQEEVKEMNRYW